MKKTILIIIVFVFLCLILTSCVIYLQDIDWRSIGNSYYKQDKYSTSGQLVTVFDERIYYSDRSKDGAGIYSMDSEGNDIRFEVTTPKIVRMISTDKKIYYIGESSTGKYKGLRYSLYEYDKDNKITKLIAGDGEMDSVYNLIVTSNGSVFYRIIIGIKSPAGFDTYTYGINGNSDEEIISKQVIESNNSEAHEIFVYSDYIITSYNDESRETSFDDEVCGPDDTIYNIETGENLMWDAWYHINSPLKVIYIDETQLYAAYENEVVIFSKNNQEVKKSITISEEGYESYIDYSIESNNKLFLITALINNDQSLYVLDLETLEHKQLKLFDSESVLINIQDDCIIYANSNMIYCQRASIEGLGAIEFEIEFRKNIVENNYFEIAGNWLFIYDKGKSNDDEPFELLYMVNLETREIIKN